MWVMLIENCPARVNTINTNNWQDAVSDLGLNLKGGLLFNRRGNAQPYLEAVLNFADGRDALIFKGGFLFVIGG